MNESSLTANILHLQRFSTEDGPGLRTSVFFKGCPLSCEWCHNPESISGKPQVQWFRDRCIRCETCISACQKHYLTMSESGVIIDRDFCSGCGACARECPANALEILGRKITLETISSELRKDRSYYQKSRGGITVTGGEPLLQSDFIVALFKEMQVSAISTALDTCGLVPFERIQSLLEYTSILLYDIKEIDPEKHKKFTHQDNRLILDNLIETVDHVQKNHLNLTIWIRTPLIPGATASPENIKGIASFLNDLPSGIIQRWEILAYNNLAKDKYKRLDMPYTYTGMPLMTRTEFDSFINIAREFISIPEIVVASGAVRPEEKITI